MNLKLLNSQISIFFADGIMNPAKHIEEINECFDKVFSNEILSVNISGVPDYIPLVKYTSKSDDYSYDFARKRLNFHFSFKSIGGEEELQKYLEKICLLIETSFRTTTGISRIGAACTYYVDEKENYWSKKYKFPLITKNTSEVTYMINNPFEVDGVKFNNIITLTNDILKSERVVPTVTVEINNEEVDNLSKEQIENIMIKMDFYQVERLLEVLNSDK